MARSRVVASCKGMDLSRLAMLRKGMDGNCTESLCCAMARSGNECGGQVSKGIVKNCLAMALLRYAQ